jgi:hypothetical protein
LYVNPLPHLRNSPSGDHHKDADQTTPLRRKHRSPSHRSTASCRRLKYAIPNVYHNSAVLTKILPEIVIIDKMPSIQNSDDRTAVHKRAGEYGIKIPQRWYCDEDKDEVEYVSAFGRNALGIPPHCKGDWTGKEDWKPSRQRKGDGDGESKC